MRLSWLIVWLMFSSASIAVTIDTHQDTHQLTSSLRWLLDSDRSVTIDDIVRGNGSSRFTQHRDSVFKLGFNPAPIWFHLPLRYQDSGDKKPWQIHGDGNHWVLYIDYPHLDRLDVYYRYADGRLIHQQVGDQIPFHQRPLRSSQFALPIELIANETVDVFIRLETTSAVHMPISLLSKKALLEKETVDRSLFGVYYGVMLVMIFYNLFIFLSFRDHAYLYYIGHVLVFGLLQATLKGQAYEFLWPNAPALNAIAIPSLVALSVLFGVQFVRHFLATTAQLPVMDKWLKFNLMLGLSLLVVTFTASYALAIKLSVALTLITTTLVISAGAISFARGHRAARFFLAAWLCLLPGASIYALQLVNLIPMNFFTTNAGMMGSLLEVVLLALALADRFNQIKRDNLTMEVSTTEQLQTANAQLSEALAKVEESNRLKDQFLAIVSHELRTPMNGVEGALDLISAQKLKSDQRRYIESAKMSAREMTSLIDTILRFSEIQAGEVNLRRETLEIRSVVNLQAVEYRRLCRQKPLEFDLQIDKKVPQFIEGDGEQIMMVIKQLVDNAIKFTTQGRVNLFVDAHPGPDGNAGEIIFTVKDTGNGIPDDKLALIFNAFNRFDAVSNRQNGLGIGLAICQRLATLMEGRLDVQSNPKTGTVAKFHLPLRAPLIDSITDEMHEVSSGDLSHKIVLVAEDNPVNQMVLKNMLQQMGCLILTANNGAQALELMQLQPVDLVMMDCQMPIMDGFETTRHIRSSYTSYRDIPIIAVTANAMSYDSGKCFAAGMNDYIKKPIHRDIVERKVRRWLSSGLLSSAV